MTQTIRHHPDPVTLIDYASGALAPALAAVVATHLLLCPRCRTDVKTLEKVGGAMLGQSGDSVAALPAISIPAAHGPDLSKPTEGAGLLPQSALDAFGLENGIPWRVLGPGVRHCPIPTGKRGGDLRLMKIAADTAVPEHSHGGTELTLVLSGAFADVTGTYHRGDVQDVDGDVLHQPKVTPDGECICLVASVAPARYSTLTGRLSQLWTRM